MQIIILGSGCANCRKLEENVKKAVAELGIKAKISKITDYAKMAEYGISATPALVIDDEVVLSGTYSSSQAIKEILGDYI